MASYKTQRRKIIYSETDSGIRFIVKSCNGMIKEKEQKNMTPKDKLIEYLSNYERPKDNGWDDVLSMQKSDVYQLAQDFNYPLSSRNNVDIYSYEEWKEFLNEMLEDSDEESKDHWIEQIEDFNNYHKDTVVIYEDSGITYI